jgi:surface antigen
MTKEDWGTTLGSVGGAVLGAAVAGDDNRWLGAAIGGAVGYFAGRQIGRHLDEQDRKALAAETVDALGEESAGTATWRSARSDASAEIKTGEISYTSQPKQVKRLASVAAVPSIKLENKEYQTTSALRVRSGPGTGYGIITTLQPGDVVNSAGRTDNGWLMLAKQDVTIGYVHADYVKPYNPVEQAQAKGIDLDSVELANVEKQEAFEGIDLDAVETTSSTVSAQAGCRDVEISVKTEKGVENETTRACQQPDGVWQLG